ncbi:MAG: hypothetical protein RR878_03215 [Anaerorhabdus sp.]|uniref:hypothetical protein n=1 Tax=Anaerorhabdus sp. TaxID=1872524 RepID=UPI002FCBC90E
MLGKVLAKSDGFFPAGYKLITSGTFAGFDSAKRIPVTIQTSYGASGKGGSIPSASVVATCSDGKNITLASGYENDNTGGYGNLNVMFSATATIDLMKPFNYDWEQLKKIKSINHSTTVVAWLEKIGGGGTKSPYKKWLRLFKKGGVKNVW